MTIPPVIRDAFKFLLGAALGLTGAILYQKSSPPEGTAEAKVLELEHSLRQTQQRVNYLEDLNPEGIRKSAPDTLMSDLQRMAWEAARGKKINPEEAWKKLRPVMAAIAPLLQAIQKKDERRRIDWRVGSLGREYDLSPDQQNALRNHFKEESKSLAEKWQRMMADQKTTLLDMARFGRKFRPDQNLDQVMENLLEGEKKTAYQKKRLDEKLAAVQRDADFRVERLNRIVPLDEAQQDQVFALMARSSRNYDPRMQFEGLGPNASQISPGESTHKALLGVMRPEQIETYNAYREQRRAEAVQELHEMGMEMPAEWDVLEDGELGWID